jgi:hypothetical protein
MGNDQPALRALFACESGLSEPEIGLEHAFVLLIWQKKHDKGKIRTVPVCKNNCKFLSHSISSEIRLQRPLIIY